MLAKTVCGALTAAIIAVATTALAHSTLETSQASPNSTYKGVLRVPHGCKGEATRTVRIQIPETIIDVRPMPKAGWTLTTARGAYAKSYDLYGKPVADGVKEIVWSRGELPDALRRIRLPRPDHRGGGRQDARLRGRPGMPERLRALGRDRGGRAGSAHAQGAGSDPQDCGNGCRRRFGLQGRRARHRGAVVAGHARRSEGRRRLHAHHQCRHRARPARRRLAARGGALCGPRDVDAGRGDAHAPARDRARDQARRNRRAQARRLPYHVHGTDR